MADRIIKRPKALEDIAHSAQHIANDSLDAALRFLDATESTLSLLASQPEMGTLCRFNAPELQGLRFFPIKGFENYLLFYLSFSAGIELVRVIHGARDVDNILSG